MKKNIFKISLFAIIVLSIVGTAIIYNKLPEQIPSHWNIRGEVDDYQSRPFIYFTAFLPLLIYGLMKLLPKIDPKKESYEKHKKAYEAVIYVLVLFMVGIHWLTASYALGYETDIGVVINLGVGIMFMVIGNYMGQIRHNYFFGIRTPWTLASESVWKKTHKAGGYIFFILGLLFILSAFINNAWAFYMVIGAVILSTLGLTVYSYLLFRKEKKL